MIKILGFVIHFVLYLSSVHSQDYFNIIPQSEGQNNQSRLFNLYIEEDYIFTIGDLMDTTIDSSNPQVRPWWSLFNQNGSLINKKVIFIEDLEESIGVHGSRIIKNNAGNYMFFTYTFTDVLNSILLEIDPVHENIVNYKIYLNPYDSLNYHSQRWFSFTDSTREKLMLIHNIEINNEVRNTITIIDSAFQLQEEILIDFNDRDNYVYYAEQEADTIYTLIGESWKYSIIPNRDPEIRLFFMKVNKKGDILNFVLGESIDNKSVLFSPADAYNVKKDKHNNWIITALLFTRTGGCPNCYYLLPITHSFSSDFTKLNWTTNLAEDINDTEQWHNVYSTTIDNNSGSILIGGLRLNQANRDAYIVKLSSEGDSLWTRHYIPLSWDPTQIAWALLRDLRITPDGGYVAGGYASTITEGLWRPWLLKIDSNGCFIPGCHNIVSNQDISQEPGRFFSIYPNPVSSVLGIMPLKAFTDEVTLSIYDLHGKLLNSVAFNPVENFQYLMDMNDFVNGTYIIQMSSQGKIIQAERFVKI